MKKQYKNSQYIIYDDGRCYSLKTHRWLKPQWTEKYPTYNLTIDGKKQKTKIHRMVAETFLPLVKDKNLINHIDGNTHNFNLTNLEWVDYKENAQHAVRTGLRPAGDQSKIEFKPLSGEEWCLIDEYPNYEVSSFGRIKNRYTNRILKPALSNHGYYEVNLWKNNKGKTHLVHQLVYSYFQKDFNLQGWVINHKDGNKLNNNIGNLEKTTYQQNSYHAAYIIKTNRCLKPVQAINKDGAVVEKFNSIAEAQRKLHIFGVGRAIRTNTKAGGYYWQFCVSKFND